MSIKLAKLNLYLFAEQYKVDIYQKVSISNTKGMTFVSMTFFLWIFFWSPENKDFKIHVDIFSMSNDHQVAKNVNLQMMSGVMPVFIAAIKCQMNKQQKEVFDLLTLTSLRNNSINIVKIHDLLLMLSTGIRLKSAANNNNNNNMMYKILWDFEIKIDHSIQARITDLILA